MRNNSLDCMPLFVMLVTAFLATAMAVADDNGRTAAEQEVVNRLAGGWRLVSRVTTGLDGKALVDAGLSVTPSGVLIYDRFPMSPRSCLVLGERWRCAGR